MPKAFDPGKPRVEYVELGKLKKWPKNPKGHDLDAIGEFFKANGFAELPIVDEGTGKMVAGHGRAEKLEAMMEAGEPPPERVETKDGKWFVPVIRGMRFRAPEKHVVASNRGVELGGWTDELAGFLAQIGTEDLIGTGYLNDDYTRMVAAIAGTDGDGRTDPDAVPVVTDVISRAGDLWILGDHRILCGDATNAADVARLMGGERAVLMATDPPYGISYTKAKDGIPRSGFKDIQKRFGSIENDELDAEGLRVLLDGAIREASAVCADKSAIYIWHPSGELHGVFLAALLAAGVLLHRSLVWKKPGFVLSRSGMYHPAHEECFYGWFSGRQPKWFGSKSQTSVWEVGRDAGAGVHPTQKPVELFEIPMMNHTKKGDVCYEPFSGSGSQIIAGERMGRRVFAMEIAPKYVDVAVRRWEEFTGRKAQREATEARRSA